MLPAALLAELDLSTLARNNAISDALVKVRAASFTPTELTWPLWTDRGGHDRASLIPAHEGSGVVVALGYGTAGVSVENSSTAPLRSN